MKYQHRPVKNMYEMRAMPTGDVVRVRARNEGAAINEARQLLMKRGIAFGRVELVHASSTDNVVAPEMATSRVRRILKNNGSVS